MDLVKFWYSVTSTDSTAAGSEITQAGTPRKRNPTTPPYRRERPVRTSSHPSGAVRRLHQKDKPRGPGGTARLSGATTEGCWAGAKPMAHFTAWRRQTRIYCS